MPQLPDPLRSADEEIKQSAQAMQRDDENDPNHFGVVGGGLVFNAADQGSDPENETARQEKKKERKKENPFGPMRQPDGEYRMGQERVHKLFLADSAGSTSSPRSLDYLHG